MNGWWSGPRSGLVGVLVGVNRQRKALKAAETLGWSGWTPWTGCFSLNLILERIQRRCPRRILSFLYFIIFLPRGMLGVQATCGGEAPRLRRGRL